MTELKCSLCPSVFTNIGYQLSYKVPLEYLICQNCARNGYLLQEAKGRYNLIQNAIYQQEIDNRMRIEQNFEDYKKRYYLNENAVFDALVSDKTRLFTQKFVKFIQDIKVQENKFDKDIKASIERIQKLIERETKTYIISEVKALNEGINREESVLKENVEKVKSQSGRIKSQVKSLKSQYERDGDLISEQIFNPDEINELMSMFNKKTTALNNRITSLNILIQKGESILSQQVDLPAKKKIEVPIVVIKEDE